MFTSRYPTKILGKNRGLPPAPKIFGAQKGHLPALARATAGTQRAAASELGGALSAGRLGGKPWGKPWENHGEMGKWLVFLVEQSENPHLRFLDDDFFRASPI